MYIQTEQEIEQETGETKDIRKKSIIESNENKRSSRKEHDRWNELQDKSTCKNYSKMSYWKTISHCTIL